MKYKYEFTNLEEDLPIQLIIHNIDGFEMNWHKEIEIILVLEGEINLMVEGETYYLKEDDLVLINYNELHSGERTKENNTLLILRIDPAFYNSCCSQFNKMKFECKSFVSKEEEQEKFNILRYYISRIVCELNKKEQGYQFKVGSYLYLLGEYLVYNFKYTIIETEKEEIKDENLIRLQRITEYLNENIDSKITLKEIAEREHLNYYYLSHLISDNLGMSFKEYLNNIRLKKAVNMLVYSNKTVTYISYANGFPNVNSFNKLFRKTYKCSPLEYRKQYIDIRYKGENPVESEKNEISSKFIELDRKSIFKKILSYLDAEVS